MTVIAWDGKTLAADKRCTAGYLVSPLVTKIKRSVRTGALITGSGNAGMVHELWAWYEAGAIPADFPKENKLADALAHLIIISREGVFKYEGTAFPQLLENKFLAWGSGCEAAMGAMMCGADAKRAVEVASEIVQGCGNGMDTLML